MQLVGCVSQARRRACVRLACGLYGFTPPGTREQGEFPAFIVSDLRELQDLAGRSVLLLRIQNPWGRRCWQGPWREG